jgi:hypothetical protein
MKPRLLVLLFSVVSCRIAGKTQPYTVLDASSAALRAQFDADVAKVRVLMLVAPT